MDYIGKFVSDLYLFADMDVPREFKRRQIEVMKHLYDEVREGTPVDTGHAVRNWQMTVGATNSDIIEEGAGKTGQEIVDSGAFDSMAPGTKDIGVRKGIERGVDSVHVFNNVHYIQSLEDGHAKKKPGAFVASAIMRAKARIAAYGMK
jgi:hypothetical protein